MNTVYKLFHSRQGSVFYRLFWTYCILITLATLTVVSVSYALFSNAFHREIEQVHEKGMTHAAEMIRYQVVVPAAQTMLEVCQQYNANANEYGSFTPQEKRAYTPFLRNLDMLKSVLGKHEQALSIDVYYRHDEILLSTTYGLRFLGENGLVAYEDVPWIQEMLASGQTQQWYSYPTQAGTQGTLVYCHTYPIFSSGAEAQGVIAIEMDGSIIAEAMSQAAIGDGLLTYLVDQDGTILLSDSAGEPPQGLADWLSGSAPGYDLQSRGGQMLSSVSVPETTWRLACLMEENQFYTASTRIVVIVGIIGAATLLMGYLLAYVIANRVYNPIHLLTSRAKEQLAVPAHQDDYALINQAISDLSHQVGELQSAIALNAPMVRNQIFSRLLSKQPANLVEIENRLRMVQVDPTAAGWNVFLVHFCEKDARGILHENRNYITYSVIAYLEQLHDDQLFLQAMDDGKMDVAVIVGSRKETRASLLPLFSCLEAFIQDHFMLQSFFCVGEWTDSLTELYACYETASLARNYQWFYQEESVLYGSQYLDRENKRLRPDPGRLQPLTAAIAQRNPRQVSEQLQSLRAELRKAKYHYSVYHDFLVVLFHTVFNTLQKESLPLPQEEQRLLAAYQSSFADMEQYFAHLEAALTRHLQGETAETQRSSQTIAKVKQYVAEHLREDLSLDLLAGQVHLTPRYLSRVFKQETGVNFTAYVNEQRVQAGEKLLRETDMTVQQIAYETGYRTPAYFISQFASRYGATPHLYRLRLLEEKNAQK